MAFGRATTGPPGSQGSGLQVYNEYRNEWPTANIRFTHAVQSTSQFVATNPFEWEYLCAALTDVAAGLRDRAMSDSRSIAALGSLISVDVPLLSVDADRAVKIRKGADDFRRGNSRSQQRSGGSQRKHRRGARTLSARRRTFCGMSWSRQLGCSRRPLGTIASEMLRHRSS